MKRARASKLPPLRCGASVAMLAHLAESVSPAQRRLLELVQIVLAGRGPDPLLQMSALLRREREAKPGRRQRKRRGPASRRGSKGSAALRPRSSRAVQAVLDPKRKRKQLRFAEPAIQQDEAAAGPTTDQLADALVTASVTETLLAEAPSAARLPVVFARAMDAMWATVRTKSIAALTHFAEKTSVFKRGRVNEVGVQRLVDSIAVAQFVADACPPKIESAVDWTPPLKAPELRATLKKMDACQLDLQAGMGTGMGTHAKPQQQRFRARALRDLVQVQMRHYARLVQEANKDEAATCARMLMLIQDLNPKYGHVYQATGDLVKSQRGYGSFVDEEQAMFSLANARPKPRQPVRALGELLLLSAQVLPTFSDLMLGVRDVVDDDPSLREGGATWRLAELKSSCRIVEKLCFDRTQRAALEAEDPDALDASGMLDTVRGMFACATMEHAVAVLRQFGALAAESKITLERSKNRFARPSGGGWMDCLINFRLPDSSLVVEVQIVHRQLLTIRAELGAHHSYNQYRAAGELLECLGHARLLGSDKDVKGHLLDIAMTQIFVVAPRPAAATSTTGDGDGDDEDKRDDVSVESQTWGLLGAPPKHVWPNLMCLDLGQARVTGLRPAPRPGSLAASILSSGMDSISSGALTRPQMVKLADALSERRQEKVSVWGCHGATHSRTINAVCFTADGTHVLTGSEDNVARLWSVAGGDVVAECAGHTDQIYSVCMAGERGVTGSRDATARLWSLPDGACLRVFQGHTGPVWSVCVSHNGRHLATGSEDKTARLWSLKTGDCVRVLQGHTDWIRSVGFTPDDERVVTGSRDKTARLWSRHDGTSIRTFEGHTGFVMTVCVTKNGQQLVTGSSDKTARLWSLDEGKLLKRFKGHDGWIKALQVTDQHLVTCSDDKTARLWSLKHGGKSAVGVLKGHTGWIKSLCLSSDGKFLATGSTDKTVRLWSLDACALARQLAAGLPDGDASSHAARTQAHIDLTLRADNRYSGGTGAQITGARRRRTSVVISHDANTGDRSVAIKHSAVPTFGVNAVCFTASGFHVLTGSDDGHVHVWNVGAAANKVVCDFKAHTHHITSLCISADSTLLVTASRDETARVWRLESGLSSASSGAAGVVPPPRLLYALAGHASWVTSVSLTPNDNGVVTAGFDGRCRVWSLDGADNDENECALRAVIGDGTKEHVTSTCVSPNGKMLVTGTWHKMARLYSMCDGLLIRDFKGHTGAVLSVAITPDGKMLVTGSEDETARLWMLEDGVLMRVFKAHTDWIRSVAITPDGLHLVTGSRDSTARLWALATGAMLRKYKGHSLGIMSVAVSGDGKYVASASSDGTARTLMLVR